MPHLRPLVAGLFLLSIAARALAAGGHFDVDDATVLDAGRCQVEAWVTRAPALAATLAHLGPACRVGPVELAANIDRIRLDGATRTLLGPQLKWVTADPFVGKLSAGVVWFAAWDVTRRDGDGEGHTAQTVYVPITWALAESVAMHLNVGLDRDTRGMRSRRRGVSGEWALGEHATVIVERVWIADVWASRLGGRWTLAEGLSVDASVARVGPGAARAYAIGLNREFGR